VISFYCNAFFVHQIASRSFQLLYMTSIKMMMVCSKDVHIMALLSFQVKETIKVCCQRQARSYESSSNRKT